MTATDYYFDRFLAGKTAFSGLDLLEPTPSEWLVAVESDFNKFLVDHAACERKASALAMSFVVRYPDKLELVDLMIGLAREELEHFHQVFRILRARGVVPGEDEKDPYVNELLTHVRHGRDERFLDRLLVASVIEARGFERLCLLADHLKDPEMRAFYKELRGSEAGHRRMFFQLALYYFPENIVRPRAEFLWKIESKAMLSVTPRPAFH